MQSELKYTTGNSIVDQMIQVEITGNIVPLVWIETIHYENGKPNWNAINILSDIVYWYRPAEVRDEVTGCFKGYKKRFKGDYLQRSYSQLCCMFNISKSQARAALEHLIRLGVIVKHLRDMVGDGGIPLRNVMFLELVPDRLFDLTFPKKNEGVVKSNAPHGLLKMNTVVKSNISRHTMECTTNTKNTTENTNNESFNHIQRNIQEVDMIDVLTKRIKKNISYDVLMKNCERGEDKIVDELVGIMIEILSVKSKYVRIGKEKYPYELVEKQFLKIEYEHILYILRCIKGTTSKILNVKAYMLAVLFNAPNTIDSFYQLEVNHDLSVWN